VLITTDKNLRYQQNLSNRKIAILELPTNRLRIVVTFASETLSALETIGPGDYIALAMPD
jgi:hypothetical protein